VLAYSKPASGLEALLRFASRVLHKLPQIALCTNKSKRRFAGVDLSSRESIRL
jgi:hypothetical protein